MEETKTLDSTRMTVWEHLRELRSVLIWVLVFATVGVALTAIMADDILYFLLRPLDGIPAEVSLHTFSPPEIIVIYLKISLLGGLILSSPFWLWAVLQFVIPGLNVREKRMLLPVTGAGLILFLCGILFTYFVVLPVSLEFLWTMNQSFAVTPHWRLNHYLSFVLTLSCVFGIAFELPLVVTVLAQLGIASPEFLRQKRPHVIVALVVGAALLTPPDVVTQLLLSLPLWLLYEISILMAMLLYPYEH